LELSTSATKEVVHVDSALHTLIAEVHAPANSGVEGVEALPLSLKVALHVSLPALFGQIEATVVGVSTDGKRNVSNAVLLQVPVTK
jgi:hypothetical protein